MDGRGFWGLSGKSRRIKSRGAERLEAVSERATGMVQRGFKEDLNGPPYKINFSHKNPLAARKKHAIYKKHTFVSDLFGPD
jgi:hypothetical protein